MELLGIFIRLYEKEMTDGSPITGSMTGGTLTGTGTAGADGGMDEDN